jgi:hypothetical protein
MDSYFEQLIEYVLENLPAQLSAQIKAHLDSGCKECNDEVEKLQDTFLLLSGGWFPKCVLDPTLKIKLNHAIDAQK